MIRVAFVTPEDQRIETTAQDGDVLLSIGQAAGVNLEGTCEGQMACSTCHVIVADEWFDKLTPASEEEEDMLDLAAGVQRTSRLSCQILLHEDLDGIELRVPDDAHDMQRS